MSSRQRLKRRKWVYKIKFRFWKIRELGWKGISSIYEGNWKKKLKLMRSTRISIQQPMPSFPITKKKQFARKKKLSKSSTKQRKNYTKRRGNIKQIWRIWIRFCRTPLNKRIGSSMRWWWCWNQSIRWSSTRWRPSWSRRRRLRWMMWRCREIRKIISMRPGMTNCRRISASWKGSLKQYQKNTRKGSREFNKKIRILWKVWTWEGSMSWKSMGKMLIVNF